MKFKLAVAFAVLFFASAIHADSVVNIQTSGIEFSDGSTLDITMQVDVTAGTLLSYSAEFIDPQLEVTVLSVDTAPGAMSISPTYMGFLLEGSGLLMNFGNFDYSDTIYEPLAFPQPGVYGRDLVYIDKCPTDDENLCGFGVWPVAGSVIVTDPPAVGTPEPPVSVLLIAGFVGLIALSRTRAEATPTNT
jgi:hypothetical protein